MTKLADGHQQIMDGLGTKCTDASNEYEGYKDFNEYLMSKSMAFHMREKKSALQLLEQRGVGAYMTGLA